MAAATNYWENRLVDGLFRLGVTAWGATTAYSLGQMIYGTNANSYGKVMVCTTAGTSSGTQPTWPSPTYASGSSPAAPATQTDGTVTWTVWNIGGYAPGLYFALLSAITDVEAGTVTETTGTSYTRVAMPPSLTNWKSTQANTANPSTGSSAATTNANAITWPAAGAGGWGTVAGVAIYDNSAGGNPLYIAAVTSQAVAQGNIVSFNTDQMTISVD
jgi:hypothetical protein